MPCASVGRNSARTGESALTARGERLLGDHGVTGVCDEPTDGLVRAWEALDTGLTNLCPWEEAPSAAFLTCLGSGDELGLSHPS